MSYLDFDSLPEGGVSATDGREDLADAALLAASVHRPSLFGSLVDRYQQAFLRKATEVIGNREDAEDIVQETFTKIYRYAGKFTEQEGASFSSWGYKILINTACSHYQRNKKRFGATTALTPELEAVLPTHDRGFAQVEASEYLLSVFVRMQEPFARVLRRYFLDGMNQQEIAREEGVSVGAVKTRMHRAKKEFREVLKTIAP